MKNPGRHYGKIGIAKVVEKKMKKNFLRYCFFIFYAVYIVTEKRKRLFTKSLYISNLQ